MASQSISSATSPSSLVLRWWILFFTCTAIAGIYYSFEIPAALHQQLKDYMRSEDYNFPVMLNLLYSVYSIPDIILPFGGGAIVDYLGAHSATALFASLTLLGQFIFAAGASYKSWILMLLGRTIYGLGSESITVATSTLNTYWFGGRELALAFGIILSASRSGAVLNNFISPALANSTKGSGASTSIWFGVMMNAISVLSALIICYLTKVGEKELRRLEMERLEGPRPSEFLTAALLEDDALAAPHGESENEEVEMGTEE